MVRGKINKVMKNSLSSPVTPPSESAVQDLILAFNHLSEQTAFTTKVISRARISMLKSELKFFTIKLAYYSALKLLYEVKLSKSNFITRWYYRKKLYKTILTLRKYQQGKLYIESLLNE
jgi:hypothetical protein